MTDNDILNLFVNCKLNDIITRDNFNYTILRKLPKDFEFDYDYGVSKLVIIPKHEEFVIKIPFNADDEDNGWIEFSNANSDDLRCWDYCFTDLIYYHQAKSFKAQEILLKTRYIGTVQNYPIYTQPKAVTFMSMFKDSQPLPGHYSKDLQEKISSKCKEKNIPIRDFNLRWLLDVFEYYGEKKFNKFISFIGLLNDLHNENIGYIDDRPVIIDYSDWRD